MGGDGGEVGGGGSVDFHFADFNFFFVNQTELSIKATDGTIKCILNVSRETVGLFYKA